MGHIRAPAVAGMFYPDDPRTLAESVARYIADAPSLAAEHAPKAIIAPHAGYVYSAAVAGPAYAQIRQAADRIRRVVLLGPGHRVAIPGVAAPTSIRWAVAAAKPSSSPRWKIGSATPMSGVCEAP